MTLQANGTPLHFDSILIIDHAEECFIEFDNKYDNCLQIEKNCLEQ